MRTGRIVKGVKREGETQGLRDRGSERGGVNLTAPLIFLI